MACTRGPTAGAGVSLHAETQPYFVLTPASRARTEWRATTVAGQMEIAKALILAGPGADDGRWARTRGSSPPRLFPIANRPILFHGLEALREAGVLEAAIVCGGATGEAIREAVGDGRRWQLSVRYLDWRSRSRRGRRARRDARLPRRRARVRARRGARCCASTCTPTSPPSRASNSTCSSCGSAAGCTPGPSPEPGGRDHPGAGRRGRPHRRRARPRRARARAARRRLPAPPR